MIDDYVRDLAGLLGPGTRSVVAEVRDHLLEAAERNAEQGDDPTEAARLAVLTFGEPALVAARFVEGGLPLPTRFTRAAGVAGVASAGLVSFAVCSFAAGALAERSRPWDGLPAALWAAGALALLSGMVLGTVATAGLLRRQGRIRGRSLAPLVLMGIAAITSLIAWFPLVWATAFGLGAVLLGAQLRRADVAPRGAVMRAGYGALAAAAVPWVWVPVLGAEGEILTVDLPRLGIGVGLIVWATGVAALGRWLAGERPPAS